MRLVKRKASITRQGFALIEVLTTILVVSFGLIGLAGMGVVGLKNNHMSYLRSIATQQAYDMADRIRANKAGATTGNYNSISGPGSDPGCIALSTGCTAANLALYDQYAWNAANAALMSSGKGTVVGNGSPPANTGAASYTITVSWTEVCTSSDPNCSGSSGITRSFSTTFVP
jgi:type IV pilus assembly protein PilV